MKCLVQTSFEDLQQYIDLILPKLVEACSFSIGRYEADDILGYIRTNHMQIWLAFGDDDLDGFILTQIIDYPQKKSLRFLCLTGVGVEGWQKFMAVIGEWLPFVRQVEDWGLKMGCSLSTIECPAPWELYLRDFGYRRGHVLLERGL